MTENLTVRSDELKAMLLLALNAATRLHEELVAAMDDCQSRLQGLDAECTSSDTCEARGALRNLNEELLFCHAQRQIRQEQIASIRTVLMRPDLAKSAVWKIDLAFLSALMKLRDAGIHLAGAGRAEEGRAMREFGKLHPATGPAPRSDRMARAAR